MKLETRKTIIGKSGESFYNFLTDLNNFKDLMPENIEKFEVDGDSFIFGLKGMPEIRLVLKEKLACHKIVLGAASSKLEFSLTVQIGKVSDSSCECQLLFQGDFNPMMAMMIKNPLQKFINTLSEKAEKLS